MEFSRPEYWSEQPFSSPGDHPNPGIEPRSSILQADSLPAEPPGKPRNTGVGSLFLFQQIFPTQESNWGLLHRRQILYQLSYQGSPAALQIISSVPSFQVPYICVVCVLSCFSCVQLFVTLQKGFSVHWIIQARILEWVAIPFSRASSRPRGRTRVSLVSYIGRQVLYHQRHLEYMIFVFPQELGFKKA